MKPSFPCASVFFAAVAILLLFRATNAETRSKKLGLAALSCGILGFAPALMPSFLSDPGDLQALRICGVIAVLSASAAVCLAIWAFRVRRRDHEVALIYPITALSCGLVNLVLGGGILGASSGVLAPGEGVPWTWQSEKGDFEVTIPSERWRLKSDADPKFRAEFVCDRPAIFAHIEPPYVARVDSEYEQALAEGRKLRDGLPGASNKREHSGVNPHGHPYWVFWADGENVETSFFYGVSITRVEKRAVILMLEGPYRLTGDIGRSLESNAFRKQAELFLSSVRSIQ